MAGRGLNWIPTSTSRPLKVFNAECTPSDSMAELPVMPATVNFVTAMATLAPIAPWIARLECAIAAHGSGRGPGATYVTRPSAQRPAAAAAAVSAVPHAISTRVRRRGQPRNVAMLLRS